VTLARLGGAVVGLLLAAVLTCCGAQKGTIGAVLAQSPEGRLFVREVPAGLAASEAGLAAGDEILLIDGRDARAMGARGVHEALSGDVGEPVRLTVVRRGEVLRLKLARSLARKYPLSTGAGLAEPR
jgi:C-terminal processing protease CtpA/Prc